MTERGRFAILARIGIRPSLAEVVRETLDAAFVDAEARQAQGSGAPGTLAVLDAGCGSSGFLGRYRARIGRLVGLDIHAPAAGSLPHLDAFVEGDLCREPGLFPPASFDLVLSKFTVEHLANPAAAFDAIRAWLRPGGTLVLVTVNRRHPLVSAYLDLPVRPRARLQRMVKASDADAHPLVGACNDPRTLRTTLAATGFEAIELRSVSHLALAWGRWWPGYLLGLAGDAVAQPFPSRRSTLVVSAQAPRA